MGNENDYRDYNKAGAGYEHYSYPSPLYAVKDGMKVVDKNPFKKDGEWQDHSHLTISLHIILIDPRGNHVNIEVLSKAKDKVSADIKNTIKSRGFVKLRIPNKKVVAEIEETINELNIRVSVDTKDMKVYNGILDYPVYLLHHKGTARSTSDNLLHIITDKYGFKNDSSYEHADSVFRDNGLWEMEDYNGITVPSDTNHPQKICFIKTDILTNYRGDQDVVLANLIKHELGHAFGILRHYKGKQIMNDQADMGDAKLDFSKLNKADIQRDVFDRISIYKFQKSIQ